MSAKQVCNSNQLKDCYIQQKVWYFRVYYIEDRPKPPSPLIPPTHTHTLYNFPPSLLSTDLNYGRDTLKQFNELGESIVRHAALFSEMMVVRGDELIKGHAALRTVLQQVNYFKRELTSALNLLISLLCNQRERRRAIFVGSLLYNTFT